MRQPGNVKCVGMLAGFLLCGALIPGGLAQTWNHEGAAQRYAHSAVFDPATGNMIIFAGRHGSVADRNDVWLAMNVGGSVTNLQWSRLFPTGKLPAGRYGHVAAYDSANNRMMVFGGGEGAPAPCSNDVWVLENANGQGGSAAWTQLTPGGTSPAPRAFHQGVYDPTSNTLTVFGGFDCSSHYYNDVWVLNNANGLGGAPVWTQLAPSGLPPAARERASAVYDPLNKTMTVFGGDNGKAMMNDVWVLSNANGGAASAWTELKPAGAAPLPRSAHTAVYDSANNRMMVYGGVIGSTTTNETWVLSCANGVGGTAAWSELQPQSTAPARDGHSAIYDPSSNYMVIFAGIGDDHVFILFDANGLP